MAYIGMYWHNVAYIGIYWQVPVLEYRTSRQPLETDTTNLAQSRHFRASCFRPVQEVSRPNFNALDKPKSHGTVKICIDGSLSFGPLQCNHDHHEDIYMKTMVTSGGMTIASHREISGALLTPAHSFLFVALLAAALPC